MFHISATCPATLASSARNRICDMTDQPIIETFESVEWKDFPNAPGVQYVDVEGSIFVSAYGTWPCRHHRNRKARSL
jgi:hypothetical protein